MDRQYDGQDFTVSKSLNESGKSARAVQQNTDPNNAYLVQSGSTVQGNLNQTSEMRWYGFILTQKGKVSIIVQTVAAVDADLYLFQLDQGTSSLNLIGGSAQEGLGQSENSCDILNEGIYYFAVSAYEGSGQYAFAFYATQDLNYEGNDSIATAATVGVNETIIGVIDNPFDLDYYTFTLSSPIIMNFTYGVGDYNFEIINIDYSAKIYEISQKDKIYQFNAGTHCFKISSKDGTFDPNKTYNIKLNKIANIANDSVSNYYMVNEPAKIVFQTDKYGNNLYVNGNEIDVSYKYYHDASNSSGTQIYDIVMENSSDIRAKIYQDEYMFDNPELTIYYGMSMPNTVYYMGGSKGDGSRGNVLELSLYSLNPTYFYKVHCSCSGAYKADRLMKDYNFATVFINPNTGKLVDIAHINYFYDYASGSNSMSFTRENSESTKYYYPYYNRVEPKTW